MSCCGQQRFVAQTSTSQTSRSAASASSAQSATTPSDPVFEYVGATALVVTGPVTGRAYRFDRRGARLVVSRHDAPSVMHVPHLRHIAAR